MQEDEGSWGPRAEDQGDSHWKEELQRSAEGGPPVPSNVFVSKAREAEYPTMGKGLEEAVPGAPQG